MNGFPSRVPLELLSLLTRRFPRYLILFPKIQWASVSRCLPCRVISSPGRSGVPDTYVVDAPVNLPQPTVKLNSSSFFPKPPPPPLLQPQSMAPAFTQVPPSKGGGFCTSFQSVAQSFLLPLQFHLNLCPLSSPSLPRPELLANEWRALWGLLVLHLLLCASCAQSCLDSLRLPWQ